MCYLDFNCGFLAFHSHKHTFNLRVQAHLLYGSKPNSRGSNFIRKAYLHRPILQAYIRTARKLSIFFSFFSPVYLTIVNFLNNDYDKKKIKK